MTEEVKAPVLDDANVLIHCTYSSHGRLGPVQIDWRGECKLIEEWVEYFEPYWHVTPSAIRHRIRRGRTTAKGLFQPCRVSKSRPDIEARNRGKDVLVARAARRVMSIWPVASKESDK